MILSNVELQRALDSGRLVIRPEPEPEPRYPDPTDPRQYCPYDTHSVDLSLGDEIVIPEPGTYTFDLEQPEPLSPFLTRNSRRVPIHPETAFPLKPHQFILGRTLEFVSLPIGHHENVETCLAARIEGKSSRARVGLLIHFTAPTVHPGFSGTLTLEMINLGPTSILLRPGMSIAQLIIEEVKGIPRPNPSQFQGQTNPEGAPA
jgi:dCTP deaminase